MVFGIDLGTTYSAISYLDKNQEPQIVLNREGDMSTPSVVYVDGDKVIVGKKAWEKALAVSRKIITCVKRVMGFQEKVMKDGETEYSPEAVSGLIIRRLVEDAMIRLEGNVEGIVVTVPTYFTDARRMATKQAVEGAVSAIRQGNKKFARRIQPELFIEIIDEPKAAALYYCQKTGCSNGTFLLYDLGGGTFDTALVEVKQKTLEILAEGEEHEAGGVFFDEKICEYVISEVMRKYGVNLKEEKYAADRPRWLIEIEDCKKRLSEDGVLEVTIGVQYEQKTLDVILTREQFNEIIDTMVHRTENIVLNMLDDKDMEPADVKQVVLVGGSSKIPYVQSMLRGLFGERLSTAVNPDMAVAYGAAVYAGMCMDRRASKDARVGQAGLELKDVCAHSIGIYTTNPNTKEKTDDILIKENTPMIAEAEKWYETVYDSQSYIKLEITEAGEKFAEVLIKIPKNVPKGTRVCVKLRVNDSHLIEAYLAIPSIGFAEEYKIQRKRNLTEEEQQELSGLIASKEIM